MSLWSSSSRRKRPLIVLGICWLIHLVGGPALGAEQFDGVYTGDKLLTTESGPSCSVERDVSLNIHSETLTFSDRNLRNFTLGFYPLQDGSFSLIYLDAGRATVNIRGRAIGDIIEAYVDNPPCGYHWPSEERIAHRAALEKKTAQLGVVNRAGRQEGDPERG